jgi:outer membrane receptor protein involved in Fe transport
VGPRPAAWAFAFVIALLVADPAPAAAPARIQGRVLAAESGEPIGFAEVALLPADTTMRRIGGLTNADGTFLLEAAPGRYTVQVRALSYARKRFEGVVLTAGQVLPFSTALVTDAIRQEEVVVEGRLRQNTETALLAARQRAASLGDAVSAEQVRRTPDKDAAEVLRRVTGLSVADGKYVFVRGLGERYSSTEVDGVRLTSPEQNKRVVPLDLFPAGLLDRVVVQKTYTADRPGEFGGGDIQVHTRDFPGGRVWRFSASQSYAEGVTGHDLLTYASPGTDIFGFGAGPRAVPGALDELTGGRPLVESSDPALGFSRSTLAEAGRAFGDVWSPAARHVVPNGSYSATYGDEFRVLGRPLGLVQSWSLTRSFDHEDGASRFFNSATDTLYDYAVSRHTASTQLGGVSAFSYRLSPSHTVHLRGLYTRSADDEVRTYEGPDHNRQEPMTGEFLHHRATRLMYVERSVLSGAVEGKHTFAHHGGLHLDWQISRSEARRQQPDRRETIYDRRFFYDAQWNLYPLWVLGSVGSREYGDLKDRGAGGSLSASLPVSFGPLGRGKLLLGYSQDDKDRTNYYRRFNFYPGTAVSQIRPPDEIFADSAFTGTRGTAYVTEATLSVDNYGARHRLRAGYLSADVPCGRRLRATLGVRVERSLQEIESFDLFFPEIVTQRGRLDDNDWLPSVNLNLAVTNTVNLRLGASRTVSRPDLNELSSSPALEYSGGFQVAGNPDLKRALIDNYDVRLEGFPGLSEVLAAGVFYKFLRQPIEQVIQGGSPNLLIPRNSDYGRNYGLELEARVRLERLWPALRGLSLNANTTFISSKVRLKERLTEIGSNEHPLQGQAAHVVNAALGYTSPSSRFDAMVLLGITGTRLVELSESPLGDIYEQPTGGLDATTTFVPWAGLGVKLAARNLLDPRIEQRQGGLEVSAHRRGRSYSLSLSYPS